MDDKNPLGVCPLEEPLMTDGAEPEEVKISLPGGSLVFFPVTDKLGVDGFWLNELAVELESRYRGVAKMLVQKLIEHALEEEKSFIWGNCSPIADVPMAELQEFYTRLGFDVDNCDLTMDLTAIQQQVEQSGVSVLEALQKKPAPSY